MPVLLLNPKIIALLVLMGAAVWIASPKTDARLIEKAADAGARHVRQTTGQYERLKERGELLSGKLEKAQMVDSRPVPKPREPFTVKALIEAMKEGIANVPAYVPNLPMMGALADAFIAYDKEGISVSPTPLGQGALAHFDWSDPKRLRIRLSPDIKRLHEKGVPMKLLAPILVHELDHMINYLYRRKHPGRTRRQDEHGAFSAEVFYMMGIGYGGKAEAVDASEYDPEKQAYLDDLKRVRKNLFSGDLKELIKDRYSSDDVLHQDANRR